VLNARRYSITDRFLRLFTDVRVGESSTVLLLTLNIFLLLTSYYVLKVVREALILTEFGAEVKAYASAGQVLLLAALVPAYGSLAGRVPRRRLLDIVTIICMGCLGVFYGLGKAGVPLGVVFFVWVGIFNVMIIAQAWAFANDVYTNDEGKRLFPIVGFGASAGAVCGSYLTTALESVSVNQLFLIAAALLGVAVVVTNAVDSRERKRTESGISDSDNTGAAYAATGEFRAESGELKTPNRNYKEQSGTSRTVDTDGEQLLGGETSTSTRGAIRLVFQSRYLLLIATMMLLLNWVNTTGEFILARTVERAAAEAVASGTAGQMSEQEFVRNFYGDFFSVVNLAALIAQLFLVSRIIKHLGVKVALLILPVIAFIGYTILAFFPVIVAVRWAKTAENSTDYSLQNTVRNVLFLPTTRAEKYKAKQAIDAFFWRAGDLLSALLVMIGINVLLFQTQHFALFNLALVSVWIVLAIFVGRRYVRLAAATA
jgi:AAA family ATP:ADP antiporter